jgi:DNA-binding transcriptional MerR regulator
VQKNFNIQQTIKCANPQEDCYFYRMSEQQQLDLFGNPVSAQKPAKKTAKPVVRVAVGQTEPAPPIVAPDVAAPIIAPIEAMIESVIEAAAPVAPTPPPVVAFETEKEALYTPRQPKPTVEKAAKSSRGRKSLKELASLAANVQVPPDEVLFEKQYHNIRDVATWFDVKISHIRFWADKFDGILKLRKNGKGDRFFRPEDVKTLQHIHHLLREKKYTIEGAKAFLKKSGGKLSEQQQAVESLKQIRSFLLELKASL